MRPRFSFKVSISSLLFSGVILLQAPFAFAEQPAPPAEAPAEIKKSAPRVKPQVIYRLPRTSNYAANLHSQAKSHANDLPIDGDMPVSLQMSRAAANAAANQPAPKPEPSATLPQGPRPESKRPPKSRSNGPAKMQGPGKSHGHKSHKK